MIEKGMILKCKTTTKNDVFGTVVWEVLETGIQAPELERKDQNDGVKVVMLGGSGASARAGLTILDSECHIQRDIKNGSTKLFPADKKDEIMAELARIPKSCIGSTPAAAKDRLTHTITQSVRHGGSGVVEM